jgi:EAL domain-containing protein (putative c-di-GMP-specific phosphodiesterase class I)
MDAHTLRELEVDYGQGWFFGRPGPPESMKDALGAQLAFDSVTA